MSKRIAFLGLGHMGLPMAQRLSDAGHQLTGYDPMLVAREAAARRGIQVAASVREAVSGAEVVVTVLLTGEQVLAAYRGTVEEPGLLELAEPGTLFVESSTISVEDAQLAHRLAAAAGHRNIDAPMSGGVVGAERGTLAFMVGGTDADVADALPLLEAMGRRVVHCGASGLGQAAKVCNNMILGVSMIAVSEAFVLGERLGLDAQTLFDVVSNASGQCWAVTTNCPVPGPVPESPANRGFAPGFTSRLMAKDLALADHAVEFADVDAPVAALASALYRRFAEGPGGELDFSAIIDEIRANSGGGVAVPK
ncbi:3-hydroxyisobutyrate dehydrogenase [Ruicaihuangia caeni]|uniref:3-hydroxyisobutyrate dehydrogenase n=1 Tax=Ruicaihuangia caeni TaxID=3042517 RepID=A0AAW6T5K1_9MICO|nr:3-hydroxyisobutyrate dehydrogenase [Klugiella sp. YN-L-19]MDI2099052.1 3-hydroxyisobutyrate dehydrogenase [Klugiella sp. YN-L-19]